MFAGGHTAYLVASLVMMAVSKRPVRSGTRRVSLRSACHWDMVAKVCWRASSVNSVRGDSPEITSAGSFLPPRAMRAVLSWSSIFGDLFGDSLSTGDGR